jgi:pilus assembly protein FimV
VFVRILECAMSNGKNPLMLMMALAMPGASQALGLGEIHVESALNERLVAEIDIVGATPDELADMRAAVANRETFVRYGAERPAFLSSATFKITENRQGRPVLAVRSSDAFTEPLVNFLVDLRWRNGEIVRQYTLLLDPPGFGAAAVAAAPMVEQAQTVAAQVDPPTDQLTPKVGESAVRKTTQVKVGAKATLRGIAWRVGARSPSDLNRLMIAILRANPGAFDGNINRMYRGAVLTIPSTAEVAAISPAEAAREVHAQMADWHAPAHTVTTSGAAAKASIDLPATANSATPVAGTFSDSSSPPATAQLSRRVQSLEQELSEVKGLLESKHDQLLALQQQASDAEKAGATAAEPPAADAPRTVDAPPTVDAPRTAPDRGHTAWPIPAGLGALAAALAALYFMFRRRAPAPKTAAGDGDWEADTMVAAHTAAADAVSAGGMADAVRVPPEQERNLAQESAPERAHDSAHAHAVDDSQSGARATAVAVADDATNPMLPILASSAGAGRSEISGGAVSQAGSHDTTINLRLDSTRLDYNLMDLDLTAQHVQMPSVLNEHAVVKERRTNLADVLAVAIEREPDRHDLRMKLLELYYSAAATNRKAFLEVVQKFARDRDYLETDQWDKIAFMGRQIAPDSPLFAEESASDDDLANCA